MFTRSRGKWVDPSLSSHRNIEMSSELPVSRCEINLYLKYWYTHSFTHSLSHAFVLSSVGASATCWSWADAPNPCLCDPAAVCQHIRQMQMWEWNSLRYFRSWGSFYSRFPQVKGTAGDLPLVSGSVHVHLAATATLKEQKDVESNLRAA